MCFIGQANPLSPYSNRKNGFEDSQQRQPSLTASNFQKLNDSFSSNTDSGYADSQNNVAQTRVRYAIFHNQASLNLGRHAQKEHSCRMKQEYVCSSCSSARTAYLCNSTKSEKVTSLSTLALTHGSREKKRSTSPKITEQIKGKRLVNAKSEAQSVPLKSEYRDRNLSDLLFKFYKSVKTVHVFNEIEQLLLSTEVGITHEHLKSAIDCGVPRLVSLLLRHCSIEKSYSKNTPMANVMDYCIERVLPQRKSPSLLVYAVQSRNSEIVKVIIDAGYSLSSTYNDGRNILHVAADIGQLNTFSVLIDELEKRFTSSYINMLLLTRDAKKGQTPEEIIFEKGDIDLCLYIISTRWKEKNINPSFDIFTLLRQRGDFADILQELLEPKHLISIGTQM
ncbi:ankyrin repeat domain-containing protein [Parashewanella spongiae]|uniref:Ankyrin repeat domain-containing protein n=1 Tax=Parashewanella spongiae TaxID=342950 RepID=A0A3A6TDQ1_9GAMM|nr:ankyrin repeat domain-containing protein [Parashewanella spongiae]MCL1079937.1 ankyrin repeat domain-containing protein [Parashewanella spongiae]RJY06202.1 ankyrin repeat domain-containing protein [Parashewanella spongiae]